MDTVEVAAEPVTRGRRKRYVSVNAVGLPHDRLENHEALTAARRLYRLGRRLVDRPMRGPLRLKIVYGNLRTRIPRGRVNPCRGWHDLVHEISHDIERLHSTKHEWLERQLAEYVRDQGWLSGKLRRPEKPKPPIGDVRRQRVLALIDAWERKRKRANNALKKLYRRKAYYDRKAAA